MDPGKIFQIITNSTLLATRLLSGTGSGPLEFSEPRYCAVLPEDAQVSSDVTKVAALHRQGSGVRYTIVGGNRDGLFTIDQHTGLITLAASLDYELQQLHELVVAAQAGQGEEAKAVVRVQVVDVNDNPPSFVESQHRITVIEEDDRDLPLALLKVEARDADAVDQDGLVYYVRGDGIDGFHPDDAFFTINPFSGDLIQLRALDRDPPDGREEWRLRVEVRDGQAFWRSKDEYLKSLKEWSVTSRGTHSNTQASWGTHQDTFSEGDKQLPRENQIRGNSLVQGENGGNQVLRGIHSRANIPGKTEGVFKKYNFSENKRENGVNRQSQRNRSKRKSNSSFQDPGIEREDKLYQQERGSVVDKEKENGRDDKDDYIDKYIKHRGRGRLGKRIQRQNNKWQKDKIEELVPNIFPPRGVSLPSTAQEVRRMDDKEGGECSEKKGKEKSREEKEELEILSSPRPLERVRTADTKGTLEDKLLQEGRLEELSTGDGKVGCSDGEKHEDESIYKDLMNKLYEKRRQEGKQKYAEFMQLATKSTIFNERTKKKDKESEVNWGMSKSGINHMKDTNNKLLSFAEADDSNSKAQLRSKIPSDYKMKEISADESAIAKKKMNQSDCKHSGINMLQSNHYNVHSLMLQRQTKIVKRNPVSNSENLSRKFSSFRKTQDFNETVKSLRNTRKMHEDDLTNASGERFAPRRYGNSSSNSRLLQEIFEKERKRKSDLMIKGTKEKKGERSENILLVNLRSFSPHSLKENGERRTFSDDSLIGISKDFKKALAARDSKTKRKQNQQQEQNEYVYSRFQKNERISNSLPELPDRNVTLAEAKKKLDHYVTNSITDANMSTPTPSAERVAHNSEFFLVNETNIHLTTLQSKQEVVNYISLKNIGNNHQTLSTIRSPTHEETPISVNRKVTVPTIRNLVNQLSDGRIQNTDDIFNSRYRLSRNMRAVGDHLETLTAEDQGGCDMSDDDMDNDRDNDRIKDNGWIGRGHEQRVHVVETFVTILVKDINDNSPIFPNATMFGEVEENGPADLSVAVVSAWDADDASEGANARLTYSIEKNVIDERNGEAIFDVHPQTGVVTTSLCCLDRETTSQYAIQVVAADGGGLKGTGTVVVRVGDVNDNSPRISRQHWELEVDETWGEESPANTSLLEITVADPDTANFFFYRIVESSGWGWEHFGIRSVGSTGLLYARRVLDFEDPTHQRGFKFMVQITDQGEGSWEDPQHMDSAWVEVTLRDVNDNPPVFSRAHAHVTLREDAAIGSLMATLPAHDPDMGGQQRVTYRVVGGWGSLSVGVGGEVKLRRNLDRDTAGGDVGVANIIAVDQGRPSLTATATLTITVTDVNDCPPTLATPTTLHVRENSPPSLVGVLTATDPDVWALGHGPPFNISLAPSNPAQVLRLLTLKFKPRLDSGRGGAEVWTVGPVDREEYSSLPMEVLLTDAGGLAALQVVNVIIDDVNDNPMKPGAKIVYLWKTQSGGSEAPLGRVYVEDPDDWDVGDKVYEWSRDAHPLFSLNSRTGDILASPTLSSGRYELQFRVSDRVWKQQDVEANVTVSVRVLNPDALLHAAPVILTPTTPANLTRGWTPKDGGGGLGNLVKSILKVLDDSRYVLEIVSVYDIHEHSQPADLSVVTTTATPSQQPDSTSSSYQPSSQPHSNHLAPSACVWLSVRDKQGIFMDPVKLLGLLGIHSAELEAATGMQLVLEDTAGGPATGGGGGAKDPYLPPFSSIPQMGDQDPSSAASRASTSLKLQVVDTNSTSLVTPRLSRGRKCDAHTVLETKTCRASSCLNGGRCIPTNGSHRCVCPGDSRGPRCKVLSRTFSSNGWAWVRPPTPCLPTTVSLRILTLNPNALLLYSGPMAPIPRHLHSPPTPLMALQILDGRPQLILEGVAGPLKLEINATISDGEWHTLHVHLHAKSVSMMVDLCGKGWNEDTQNDAHCLARESLSYEGGGVRMWAASGPLQLGGVAHTPQLPENHGWTYTPITRPLQGCLSYLTFNGQLVDLGEPVFSRGSASGCHLQDRACMGGGNVCGGRGQCVGGLTTPSCSCDPGWTGSTCHTPTSPATLATSSYMKIALSFTPSPQVTYIQLRVRTWATHTGLLVHLANHHRSAAFMLHVRASVACASVSGMGVGWAATEVCVEDYPLDDGTWHIVRAERHAHNLIISVDDGDGWRSNASLPALYSPDAHHHWEPPAPLLIDKHDGVTVGGRPEFVGVNLFTVHEDLSDTCIDDLRLSGRPLPLPPAVNGTTWGQVTTMEQLERGCLAPDACLNTTCTAPLSCHSSWGRATCSCGPGMQQVGHTCKDVDECLWEPCLHGGTCLNLRPGYQCLCGPSHVGDNCQWTKLPSTLHPLAAPVAIAAMTLSVLVLVLLGVVVSIRFHRQRGTRGLATQESGGQGETGGEVKLKRHMLEVKMETKPSIENSPPLTETEEEDDHHNALLDLLKLRLPKEQPSCHKTGIHSAASEGRIEGAKRQEATKVTTVQGDDLRHYAYEGDSSSSGSLVSTISGLRAELEKEDPIRPMIPEFLEVLDLLKNLPESSRTSCPLLRLHRSRERTCDDALSNTDTTGKRESKQIPFSTAPFSSTKLMEENELSLIHVSTSSLHREKKQTDKSPKTSSRADLSTLC